MTEKYNGWTNWETWNAYTILMNEEGLYSIVMDFIEELKELKEEIKEYYEIEKKDIKEEDIKEDILYGLEKFLKDLVEELAVNEKSLDFGSVWRINFREIAEAVLEE